MIKEKYNQDSKKFMQKILIFIDSVFVNVANSDANNSNAIFVNSLLNIRDSIFSEILKDNQLAQIKNELDQQEKIKKKEKEENQNSLSQEKE